MGRDIAIEISRAARCGARNAARVVALCLPVLLGACASEPTTVFAWGVDDTLPRTVPARPRQQSYAAPRATPASYYAEGNYSQTAAPPVPRARPAYYAAAPVTPTPAPRYDNVRESVPLAGNGDFIWPVSGSILSNFGATLNGERNDGINIAAIEGTPIHAAASGVVSYAGNELKGYGNLVLIRHDNGYVTAYAHAQRLAVGRGDTVTKGQVIGYAGRTGDVSQPQLHFEIRRGVAPVNPRPLLVASR